MALWDRKKHQFYEISMEFLLYIYFIHMGVSENSIPLNPMVLLIIIPFLNGFNWEYTQYFQTNPYLYIISYGIEKKHHFYEISMELLIDYNDR